MAKKFVTQRIREQAGQYTPVDDRTMIKAGHERMNVCEACGKTIQEHFGVIEPEREDGELSELMWVGRECYRTLCAPDAQPVSLSLNAGERVERIAWACENSRLLSSVLWKPGYQMGRPAERVYTVYGFDAERSILRSVEGRGWATRSEYNRLVALLQAVAV
jgi:hypothetical protein